MSKLKYGVGINDADYIVIKRVNGKNIWCPYYRCWTGMIRRSYCEIFKREKPSYIGVTTCDAWHSFMDFRSWMMTQDWDGNHLDKDLLVPGNKVYSPKTCVFVSPAVNVFMTDRAAARGEYPIGVSLHKQTGKYQSRVRVSGKCQKHLGLFSSPAEAHRQYRIAKFDLAKELSGVQSNEMVAKALLNMYRV